MKKVSVIVPVYNVEKYVAKCLDSLLAQTLKEIEIIIVDDGSKDNSSEIIQRYAEKYPNIFVYRKENGGLSDARNYGMKYAKGEYIGFVDSDDYVEPDMYELLYNKAKEENSVVVECNLYHDYEGQKQDIEIGETYHDKKDLIMYGRSVVWNKIYQREWLEETKVLFPKGLVYEDVQFFIQIVPYIQKISYIKQAGIHYVQRSESINHTSTLKTLQILDILKNIKKYYIENGFYGEYKEAIEFLTIRILLCSSFKRICGIRDKKDRKCALQENWNFLENEYPHWKKNPYLRQGKGKNAMFMKYMNRYLYRFCGILFSIYEKWR